MNLKNADVQANNNIFHHKASVLAVLFQTSSTKKLEIAKAVKKMSIMTLKRKVAQLALKINLLD